MEGYGYGGDGAQRRSATMPPCACTTRPPSPRRSWPSARRPPSSPGPTLGTFMALKRSEDCAQITGSPRGTPLWIVWKACRSSGGQSFGQSCWPRSAFLSLLKASCRLCVASEAAAYPQTHVHCIHEILGAGLLVLDNLGCAPSERKLLVHARDLAPYAPDRGIVVDAAA